MCQVESLKPRMKKCVLIFVTLIFLDCFAALNSIEGFIENVTENKQDTTATIPDLHGLKGGSKGNMTQTDLANRISWEGDTKDRKVGSSAGLLDFLVEMVVFCVLLACNSCALVGVRRQEAFLLVPWLAVFLLGIFR